MKYDDFLKACEEKQLTKDAEPLLRSLFLDRTGDWDGAHSIAQSIPSRDGSLVHAYLHREEGDLGNAGYWYSRAGTSAPQVSLDSEWDTLARNLTD